MVSLVTKKWSHFSTESMFDLTETVLNVSSWAAGITPLFLFLVMSINHFITKAISAINFSALCEVDAQWYKLHFGVWATWNVGGSNHKSQMYMVWCHGTLLKGDACLAKAELSMVGIYQVDQTTRWTPKVTIFWVEFSSKETAWKTDTSNGCVWATLFQDNQPCQMNRTVGVILNMFAIVFR